LGVYPVCEAEHPENWNTEVETWRGRIGGTYLDSLKDASAGAILTLAPDEGGAGH